MKILFHALPAILLILLNYSGNSQTPKIKWQNTIGGNGYDQLASIATTSDGGCILGGISNSPLSGDKTEDTIGSNDIWIVKVDSLGNILWQNTIGGTGNDYLYSILQTGDGGYFLGGTSNSNISGDKTENTNGGYDFWIVKIDSLGNIIWQNSIGGSGAEELSSSQQTTDGGFIMTGSSSSNISGDKSENNVDPTLTTYDYWVIKTDSVGNIQWQNTIGGDNFDESPCIRQAYDGGYILGGWSMSGISGDKTEASVGGYDYWIIKLDSIGNIQWQNTIGGNATEILTSVRQTFDGGYILGGSSVSGISGDKTEDNIDTTLSTNDFWIVKTDSVGNIQWQNTIGGKASDALNWIQQTADSGYVMVGFSRSGLSGDKTENGMGNNDFWIVKTNPSGTIQWQSTIGGSGGETPVGIEPTADSGYMVGGFSGSPVSGDKTEPTIGQPDYWILKLSDSYNSITGKLFADENSSNIQDSGEASMSGIMVAESGGKFAFTQLNGDYSVAVFDTGNFTFSPSTINYYVASPASQNSYFPGLQLIDSLNNFAFQPTTSANDLSIYITANSAFRAGRNVNYIVTCTNTGTTTLSPTIILLLDTNVTFINSTPTPDNITIDSLVWSPGQLSPFQTADISVTLLIDSSAGIGTEIFSEVIVEPIAGDADPSSNISIAIDTITGSYDPNDISVDEDTLFITQLSTPPFLDYTIRFQNTGNDTAFAVKILNPIDSSKLQLSTLELLASSHPVNLNYLSEERNMEFRFENILLPDSNIDEQASHGFVRYRIKPKSTLAVGDSIINYAGIYFDFNAPVLTNQALTVIILPTFISKTDHSQFDIHLYPNPAGDRITINSSCLNDNSLIRIYDLMGREMITKKLQMKNQSVNLDVATLKPGTYLVEIFSGGHVVRSRLVKN